MTTPSLTDAVKNFTIFEMSSVAGVTLASGIFGYAIGASQLSAQPPSPCLSPPRHHHPPPLPLRRNGRCWNFPSSSCCPSCSSLATNAIRTRLSGGRVAVTDTAAAHIALCVCRALPPPLPRPLPGSLCLCLSLCVVCVLCCACCVCSGVLGCGCSQAPRHAGTFHVVLAVRGFHWCSSRQLHQLPVPADGLHGARGCREQGDWPVRNRSARGREGARSKRRPGSPFMLRKVLCHIVPRATCHLPACAAEYLTPAALYAVGTCAADHRGRRGGDNGVPPEVHVQETAGIKSGALFRCGSAVRVVGMHGANVVAFGCLEVVEGGGQRGSAPSGLPPSDGQRGGYGQARLGLCSLLIMCVPTHGVGKLFEGMSSEWGCSHGQ